MAAAGQFQSSAMDGMQFDETPSLAVWKKLLFAIVAITLLFLGLETVIRVGAYLLYNRSPYFLYYGFREAAADDDPEGHNVPLKGYAKFQPHRQLHQYGMFAKPTPIRINAVGLRGHDFKIPKPDNQFRVICMGESSTFGFFDRDEGTYPALLERNFADGASVGRKPVETINAGIPHANSDNILAMLRGELLTYQPDVLTLYAGFNDAVLMMDETAFQRTLRWTHAHVATYVALKRLSTALGGPLLHSRWSGYLSNVPPQSVQRQIELHVARYERNVRDMVALARQSGSKFVFVKQPIVMEYDEPGSEWRKFTYAERVARARDSLRTTGSATGKQTVLLVHSALMQVLDRLGTELGVPVVDNIAIVDRHPEYLASYVHLTEEANAALARSIHEAILGIQ